MHTKQTMMEAKEPIFTCGTLRYTTTGIVLLFFFLFWNDLALMLMEQVAPTLVPLLLKDHGAANWEIAFYTTTFTSLVLLVINPIVSTVSDRHRGRFGRRRPFLLAATPFCALFLAAIPYMPKFVTMIAKWPFLFALFHNDTSNVSVVLIGTCSVIYTSFNSVILTLFTYYFWDVVPEAVLARFTALTKIVSTLAVFYWNYSLLGYSDHHIHQVFVGIALFFFSVYATTLWFVREGSYPAAPAPSHPKGNWIRAVREYAVECFGESYFRWVFAASTLFQLGNVSNTYQMFFFRDELLMNLDTIGKLRAWPTLGVVFLGYFIGFWIDRAKPMRVIVPILFLFSLSNVLAFFFVHDKWSLMTFFGMNSLVVFAIGVCQSALWPEIFPRDKIGQFCSANQITQVVVVLLTAVLVGLFFDWAKSYRYAFLWSAAFQMLSALAFWKVLIMWRVRQR